MSKLLLSVLLFAPLLEVSAFGGIHPLQLEKDTDTAKCVECHGDKAAGKHLHPAVDMGCLTCHVIRNSGETTRVNLKTAKIATLCFQCHADKQGTENERQVHPPTPDCLKCHDAHTSDNDHLLLKPTSGGKAENLCLGCHDKGVNVPDKGSRHAVVDGCDGCHLVHKIGKDKSGEQEFDSHLTQAVPALCDSCHDAKDAKLVEVHKGQPIAGSKCTGCHDPHDSKSPKLAQKYLHSPFEGSSCDACHQPAKDGKVILTGASAKEVCLTCHSDKGEQIEKAKVQHPGAAGDCTDCHSPHAGRYPRFVRPGPVSTCESCHPDQKDIHQTKEVLHQPVYRQACSVCHEPHGGDREHLLRADGNSLCLTCHGPKATGAKVADSKDISIFGGAVLLPEGYLDHVFQLQLDTLGLGHPQARHPVGGVLDPSDPKKVRMITCGRCHTPHGGGEKLLVTGADTSASLCAQCHGNLSAKRAPAPAQVPAQDKKKRNSR
jgi:predicted CXXCH cytochrome family protein